MKKPITSTICQTAVIIDLQDSSIHHYADLEAKLETPGVYRAAAHETSRDYLVYWVGGIAATHVNTRLSPEQFQPEMIESLYRQATRLKPCDLSRRRMGGR